MDCDVFLLDGSQRSTLAACRSLGRRGLKVAVAGTRNCIVHSSKYCAVPIITPEITLPWISAELERIRPRVLFPMTDHSLDLVSGAEHIREKVILPFPTREILDCVQLKDRFLDVARRSGVSVPRSWVITSTEELKQLSDFPLVLKTARAAHLGSKPAVLYVSTREELNQIVGNPAFNLELPLLAQERILGPGVGVFILADKGLALATFAHHRLLDKPPSGGVSVLCESLSLDQAPVREAQALIRDLNWSGVAMVEFKIRESDSKPFVLEINPRLWGSLQLSISCGVDFPWLLYLYAVGELDSSRGRQAIDEARNYRVRYRLRWDLGTLDHLLIRIKNEGIGALSKTVFRNELQLFSSLRVKHETFCWDDPVPAVQEFRNYIKDLVD